MSYFRTFDTKMDYIQSMRTAADKSTHKSCLGMTMIREEHVYLVDPTTTVVIVFVVRCNHDLSECSSKINHHKVLFSSTF